MQSLLNFTTVLLRCTLAFFRSRNQQAIVELALRQQLATYAQTRPTPRLTPLDRTFWVALLRLWPRWKEILVIVKPDTVVRWHRKGFRFYWRWISTRGPGRPRVSKEVQALIRRFALENGWGARKVHAELEKLGFSVWFDEFSLKVGDSLRRTIDRGLRLSRFGVIILSKDFFAKNWTQYELNGLVSREIEGKKVILPVWHGVTKKEVEHFSPPLSDKVAANTAISSIRKIARALANAMMDEENT